MKRLPNGVPIPGTDAVAADVITLLSGVNFGSVVKVLAAIDVLADHLKISRGELIQFANVPKERAQFDGDHEERVTATDAMVRAIVKSGRFDDMNDVLKHNERFK